MRDRTATDGSTLGEFKASGWNHSSPSRRFHRNQHELWWSQQGQPDQAKRKAVLEGGRNSKHRELPRLTSGNDAPSAKAQKKTPTGGRGDEEDRSAMMRPGGTNLL